MQKYSPASLQWPLSCFPWRRREKALWPDPSSEAVSSLALGNKRFVWTKKAQSYLSMSEFVILEIDT